MVLTSPPPYQNAMTKSVRTSSKDGWSLQHDILTPEEKLILRELQSIETLVVEDENATSITAFEDDEKLLKEYPDGFAENHYLVYTAIRIPFLAAGIPVGIRRSKRIRCHGHGGKCGKYAQDTACRTRHYGCSVANGCPTVGSRRPLHVPHPSTPKPLAKGYL